MNFDGHRSVWTVLAALAVLQGCQMVTTPNPPAASHTADHVVINEVFTLPSDYFGRYSWVELYNPTTQAVPVSWLLVYQGIVKRAGSDTTILDTSRLNASTQSRTALRPGGFLVVSGDSARLFDHTDLGPGAGLYVESRPNPPLLLTEVNQVALLDSAGNLIDLVRFGNFVPPSPDPYPENHSAGMIPMWYSLARYAGAYATGNTAGDFYMEPKPVPGWYNQELHP